MAEQTAEVLAFPGPPAPGGPRPPLPDEVLRTRLTDRLARRFEVAVTTVVAGAGFGKSTLLAQAVRANAVAPAGLDVLHACSAVEDPAGLATALTGPLGTTVRRRDPAAAAHRVAEVVAAQAPAEVALLVDDVHVLDEDGPAVALLAELVRVLPTNGHLVLASRRPPPVPLARLRAADQLVELGEDDLRFTADEVDELAAAHHADLDLDELAGWPAVVRLALAVGHQASADFLWEEVLAATTPTQRRALAALALAGEVPTAVLDEVLDPDGPVRSLLAGLPLLSWDDRGGTVAAHGLWAEVLDHLAEPDEQSALAEALAWQCARAGDHDRALALALRSGDAELVAGVVLRSLAQDMLHFDASTADDWLDELPPEVRRLPAGRLLAAIAERKGGRADDATRAQLWALADELHDLGDASGEAIALGELVGSAFARQRLDELEALDQRVSALQDRATAPLQTLAAFVRAARADSEGDPGRALTHLEAIVEPNPAVARLVDHWRSSLLVLVGRADDAVAVGARVRQGASYLPMRASETVARWFAGDPTGIAGTGVPPAPRLDARDAFLMAVHVAMFRSSLEGAGTLVDVDRLAELAGVDGRDQAFLALCRAAQAVADGDEPAAAHVLDELVDRSDHEGGPFAARAEHELRRFLCYPYVLHAGWRAALDAVDEAGALGPVHRRRRRLARLLVDLRAGVPPDWSAWLPPGEVVTALPLRWTVELAARAAHHGRDEADDLAALLGDLLDDPGRAALRAASTDDDPVVAAGATDLLARVPVPPTTSVRVELLGPPRLLRDGEEVEDAAWRRGRVRQLLGLLVLRGTVRRDVAMATMWPDADPAAAGRNLRTTLSHLRRLLEPDRRPGEAPWFLRQRGEDLVLAGEPRLEVDVWELRRHREAARHADADARSAQAVHHHLAVVERWRGAAVADLRDVEGTDHERIELEQAVVASAQRAAELLLTDGAAAAHDRVPDLVAVVLAIDPYHEGALRLLVLEALARHDRPAARAAAARCRAALDDLGVDPTPETSVVLRRADGDAWR